MRSRRPLVRLLAIVVAATVLADALVGGATNGLGGIAHVARAATPELPSGGPVSSTSPAASAAPSPPGSPVASGSAPPAVPSMDAFTDDATRQLLARAGVAVYADEQATEPVTFLEVPEVTRVTEWQLRNMAAEARASGGIAGKDLDRAVRLKGTKLPFSYLIAAWLSTSDSIGATALREHMGAQQWTHAPELVYPTLALELFTADVATAGGQVPVPSQPASGPASKTALAAVALTVGGPAIGPAVSVGDAGVLDTACSSVTGFINGALGTIFGALRIDASSLGTSPPAKVLRFFADLWNTAVGLARQVVTAAITQLTAPIVAAIRLGIGLVALISQVASYLKPWAIDVDATPTGLMVPFGAPGATGSFRARADVSVQSEQWPPVLLNCAKAIGKPLPELAAAGAPTSWAVWGTAPGLVTITTPGAASLALAQDRTSTIAYETLVDPPENVDGPLLYDVVWATVTVQRKEVTELQEMIRSFAYGQLPGPVLTVVQATIGPQLDRLLNHAASLLSPLLDARGRSVDVTLAHHGPPPVPTPTPVRGVHWSGTWASAKYDISGTFTVDWVQTGSRIVGTATVTGSPCGVRGGPLSGTISGTKVSFGVVEASQTVTWQGKIGKRRMSGTFRTGAPCGNDRGTFAGTR